LIRRHFGRIIRAQWRVTRDALAAWRGAAARARLRGQMAGVLGLPRVLAWRQKVQQTRQVSIDVVDAMLLRD